MGISRNSESDPFFLNKLVMNFSSDAVLKVARLAVFVSLQRRLSSTRFGLLSAAVLVLKFD